MNEILYFETIKCEDEEIFNLKYHQQRISRTIGKNINLGEYIYPPSSNLLRCKVIYSQDEVIDISYTPYIQRNLKRFKIIIDDDIKYAYKELDRVYLDVLNNDSLRYDDIIIIKDGLVTDTTIANIAIFKDGFWLTPVKPLLQGTTRDRLLDDNLLKESNITLEMLLTTKRFAIMNAMIGFCELEEFTLFS